MHNVCRFRLGDVTLPCDLGEDSGDDDLFIITEENLDDDDGLMLTRDEKAAGLGFLFSSCFLPPLLTLLTTMAGSDPDLILLSARSLAAMANGGDIFLLPLDHFEEDEVEVAAASAVWSFLRSISLLHL